MFFYHFTFIGSIGLVHTYCLEKWISISCSTRCELCSTKYKGRKILKYGILSSVPRFVWAHKGDCGIFYCYAKIWLYLYILTTLLREYRIDKEHLPSSISFLLFLVVSFITGVFLLAYSLIKCFKTWNRWRKCQFKFVIAGSTNDMQHV